MLTRVQLMLDDDLDERIAFRAKVEAISRSEVVRRILRAEFPPLPPLHEDPIWFGVDPVDVRVAAPTADEGDPRAVGRPGVVLVVGRASSARP